MILLGLIFAILVLVFLAVIIFRGYLNDEAMRKQEVENEVKKALKAIKENENGKS